MSGHAKRFDETKHMFLLIKRSNCLRKYNKISQKSRQHY